MRLKHVAAIDTLNESRVKLEQFQLFKKSEIERMLNEERERQNLKLARVEKENKKMMLTSELRRLLSLMGTVSERFSQMLQCVPEEVLALEKSTRGDDEVFHAERRKRSMKRSLPLFSHALFLRPGNALSSWVCYLSMTALQQHLFVFLQKSLVSRCIRPCSWKETH